MCGSLSYASRQGTWPKTQACALTGNQTGDPLLRSPVLNPLSHTGQGTPHKFNLSLNISGGLVAGSPVYT